MKRREWLAALALPWALPGAVRVDEVTLFADRKPSVFVLRDRVTVMIFLSTVCPISNDYNDRMGALYRELSAKGVQWLAINANQNEPWSEVDQHRQQAGYPFPVWKDRNNVVADKVGASVTPEVFVFDKDAALRYQGQIDDSRNPARTQVLGLKNAVEQLLAGQPVTKTQTKAFGCTIKRVRKSS
ncbi:MAG: redoxin domain-containing protein [Bryobacterales bacterium]|nr:redoxin domain-containing protein [Bryobacterales bacterium]